MIRAGCAKDELAHHDFSRQYEREGPLPGPGNSQALGTDCFIASKLHFLKCYC